jgi:aspartate-semialdehyde dehydrogenase
MSGLHVAILGATGMVGQELLDVLVERQVSHHRTSPFCPRPAQQGAGSLVGGKEYAVQQASAQRRFRGVDRRLLCRGRPGEPRTGWRPAVDAGAVVIDNTSAFRLRDDVPLIVPEVNAGEEFLHHQGIISNPNCSTIIMAIVLEAHLGAGPGSRAYCRLHLPGGFRCRRPGHG